MITIISGTNRSGSKTLAVANEIQRIYKVMKASCNLIDLTHLPPEIFRGDSYSNKPVSFHPFSKMIMESDGLVIVTPEYNGGFPGVLKYFIDMLKFPESFEHRPVCFVGIAAGRWGALRPVEQLQMIFSYRNAYIFSTRVFIPSIMSVLDDQGHIIDDAILDRLRKQAEGFISFAKHLRSL